MSSFFYRITGNGKKIYYKRIKKMQNKLMVISIRMLLNHISSYDFLKNHQHPGPIEEIRIIGQKGLTYVLVIEDHI